MATEFQISLSPAEIGVLYTIVQSIEANTTQRKDMLYMATLRSVKGKLEKMMDDYVKGTQNEAHGHPCDSPGSAHDTDGVDN